MLEGTRGVLYRGERYLLAQHAHPLPEKVGKWSFLGGLIDVTDISPEAALKREIREEVQQDIKDLIFIGDRTYNNRRYRIFAAEIASEIAWFDDNEISALKWFSIEEVRDLHRDNQLHTGFEYSCISEWVTRKEYMTLDSASMEPRQQAGRRERLQATYNASLNLLLQEAKAGIDRTNIFLVFSTLLFTTFAIIRQTDIKDKIDSPDLILFWLPVIGIAMCLFHVATLGRAKDAADFWRGSIRLIEQDQDFWYPGKMKVDNDLDIFHARVRYLTQSLPTRQTEHKFRNRKAPIPMLASLLMECMPSSDRIYMYWVPGFIASLWIMCLASQVWRVLSAA